MHFLLIEDKGAAIEAECKNGRTPLLWAAANGYEASKETIAITSQLRTSADAPVGSRHRP